MNGNRRCRPIIQEALVAAYKDLKKLDPNELVEPKMCITTKVLNFKQARQAVYDVVPNNRTDGQDLLPDELKQWMVDVEARALVRNHAYGDAFAKVKNDLLCTQSVVQSDKLLRNLKRFSWNSSFRTR